MNGHRSPLGDGVNGNIPADYLAACRTCEPTGRLTRRSPSSPPTGARRSEALRRAILDAA